MEEREKEKDKVKGDTEKRGRKRREKGRKRQNKVGGAYIFHFACEKNEVGKVWGKNEYSRWLYA